jgi:hypothetical protein
MPLTNGSGYGGGQKTYGSGSGLGSATLIFRFRTVKLRGRSEAADTISQLIDYEQFCGTAATDKDNTGLHILRKQIISDTKHYVISYNYSYYIDICVRILNIWLLHYASFLFPDLD